MRAKSCKRCGRAFVPVSKHTYLCPECHTVAKSSGVIQDRQCRQCGTTFPGGPRAWYCPDCRADRRREQSRKARQSGTARPIGSTDLCQICGTPYVVNSSRQKYCPDCAEQAVNETVRRHKREYAANRAEQMAEYKRRMSSNRSVCVICGAVFDAHTPTATCSPECDKIRRQRSQAAVDKKRSPRNGVLNMTDKQFMACVSEAANYTDRDAYVSDVALSSMWGDSEDAEIPVDRIDVLRSIWDACHRSAKAIAADAGMSCRKLAEHFCIPYRTMEDWSAGRRECPIYTRLMMQECLGLLHR